jgi:hypothetical protein
MPVWLARGTSVSAFTLLPVNALTTACVIALLSMSKTTHVVVGAVQRYHTELPDPVGTVSGSPGSSEAPTFVPETEPVVPEAVMSVAASKLSFGGVTANAASQGVNDQMAP